MYNQNIYGMVIFSIGGVDIAIINVVIAIQAENANTCLRGRLSLKWYRLGGYSAVQDKFNGRLPIDLVCYRLVLLLLLRLRAAFFWIDLFGLQTTACTCTPRQSRPIFDRRPRSRRPITGIWPGSHKYSQYCTDIGRSIHEKGPDINIERRLTQSKYLNKVLQYCFR